MFVTFTTIRPIIVRRMRATLLLVALAMMGGLVCADEVPPQDHEVRAVVDRFLRAFESLDMQSFIHCFANDATVFFPIPEPPRRFDGKGAIQAQFEQVFAAIRQSSTSSSPPFHRLVPENLRVQLLSDGSAVVTFQLSSAERIARRTLVFSRRGGTWLIVHLHASNVPSSAPDAAHAESNR